MATDFFVALPDQRSFDCRLNLQTVALTAPKTLVYSLSSFHCR